MSLVYACDPKVECVPIATYNEGDGKWRNIHARPDGGATWERSNHVGLDSDVGASCLQPGGGGEHGDPIVRRVRAGLQMAPARPPPQTQLRRPCDGR